MCASQLLAVEGVENAGRRFFFDISPAAAALVPELPAALRLQRRSEVVLFLQACTGTLAAPTGDAAPATECEEAEGGAAPPPADAAASPPPADAGDACATPVEPPPADAAIAEPEAEPYDQPASDDAADEHGEEAPAPRQLCIEQSLAPEIPGSSGAAATPSKRRRFVQQAEDEPGALMLLRRNPRKRVLLDADAAPSAKRPDRRLYGAASPSVTAAAALHGLSQSVSAPALPATSQAARSTGSAVPQYDSRREVVRVVERGRRVTEYYLCSSSDETEVSMRTCLVSVGSI